MKLQKTFQVNYYRYLAVDEPERTQTRQWTHRYEETWGASEFYCPCCGKKEVWTNQGAGDYYIGAQSLCVACGATHYLESSQPSNDQYDQQRLEVLRS